MSPALRQHFLGALTDAELRQGSDRGDAVVILPTGAFEQHGRHLPVAVDALMGVAWLEAMVPLLEATPWWFSPAIWMGKSNEHTGFPGTMIVSRTTLRRLLLTTAAEVAAAGFRKLAILNTHGGNVSVVRYTLPEIEAQFGLQTTILRSGFTPEGMDPRELAFGIHANEAETSYLLHLAPEHVDMNEADEVWIGDLDDPSPLKAEFAPATYAWQSSDLSPSGTMGNASIATAAKGEAWIDAGAAGLARAVQAFAET